MTKRFTSIILALSFVFLIMSCDRKRNDKGYEYFPDMAHSLAFETYAPNPNVKAGESMLLPAPNTVPMELDPYVFSSTPEDRLKAAATLVNPYEMTEAGLIRGKEQYKIFCAHCHGDNGNGEGFLYTSKKYSVKPASLMSEKMLSTNEADIYHVITVGYQVMGAHGHMIRPADRWMIAMYVKNELQKQ